MSDETDMKVVLSATMSGEDFSDSSVLLHASANTSTIHMQEG